MFGKSFRLAARLTTLASLLALLVGFGSLSCPSLVPSKLRGGEASLPPPWLIFSVKTDLQKKLVGFDAGLYVVFDTTDALKSGKISLPDLGLKHLKEDLLKYKKKDKVRLQFTLFIMQDDAPGSSENRELVRLALIGFGHELGFEKITVSMIFTNSDKTWKDWVEEGLAAMNASETEDAEPGTGDDSVTVYAVRSKFSRYFTGNADCVVDVHTSVADSKGQIPKNVKEATKKYVDKLKLEKKRKIVFSLHDQPADAGAKQLLIEDLFAFAKDLGFETSSYSGP